jgi:hypothetical protein
MSYFKKFPKLVYDFNREGVVNSVVDLFRQVRPVQNYVDNFSAYKFYSIKDGERPDIVSQKIYGTTNYYWTFFIINDFLHDGLGSWPMSGVDLEEYINIEYNGYALETRPKVKRDTDDGITSFENSLAGEDRFQNQGAWTVGRTVTGAISGATGTLKRKDLYLNQLVVQDVTGTFLGDGAGNVNEDVTGSWIDPVSGAIIPCSVQCWKAWSYAEAPHHYYISGDGDTDSLTLPDGTKGYGVEAHVSSANFFSTTDDATLNLIIQEGSTAAPLYTSNRSYLFKKNEERSKIRIIDPAFIPEFASKFESLINV